MREYSCIDRFEGKYAFLSNFYYNDVEFEGITYPTNEHAFQAAKTFDISIRNSIREYVTPRQAKRRGRSLILREDWENVKVDIMTEIVRNKFMTNPILAGKLLETGEVELIEGTTWHDTFWGIDLETGEGENYLGRILMNVRRELRNAVTNCKNKQGPKL